MAYFEVTLLLDNQKLLTILQQNIVGRSTYYLWTRYEGLAVLGIKLNRGLKWSTSTNHHACLQLPSDHSFEVEQE